MVTSSTGSVYSNGGDEGKEEEKYGGKEEENYEGHQSPPEAFQFQY